ncbi:MAG: DUF167 domain-containing protein [Rhodospirillaceae bacterium]
MSFFRPRAGGLTLTVRVTPKASRDAILGVMATPDGLALKVAVTAPADKGKANAAVIALLAKAFGVAKSNITLTLGETDRRKVLRISGDPATLAATAQTWMTS